MEIKNKKLNILFVCRANCFRSRIAEAYFNKINKNKDIKAKSAGVIYGYKQSPTQIKIAREFGINIKGKSRGISSNLLKLTDILIIAADDVPQKIFNYEKNKKYIKRVIVWNIKDVKIAYNKKDVKRAIKQIIKKVNKLNKQLKKGEIK